jgi:hypothetical protein
MSGRAVTGTDEWDAAVACGLIRLGAGVALLRWPSQLARLAGARDDDTLARAVIRGFGARDLALGVGALAATRPVNHVSRSLRIQAAADAVDGAIVAGAVATGRLPRGRGIAGVVIAVLSSLSLFVSAHQLDATAR